MQGFTQWLRSLSGRLSMALRRFMTGRYGTDKLNMAILMTGLGASILSMLMPNGTFRLICWALSYALMIWAICRTLSRNTYKRYLENRKYLMLLDRLKDRQHRYFECPRCRQQVRVPRGKGKISITCPKCREKFVKKT